MVADPCCSRDRDLPVVTTTPTGRALAIAPWMVSLPPVPTFVLRVYTTLGALVMSVITMADVRDRLGQVRREQAVQAWHLRHLVPQSHDGRGVPAGAIVVG